MPTYVRSQAIGLVVFFTLALHGGQGASALPLTAANPSTPPAVHAEPLGYVEPAPVRVYRSYVYATMKSRRNKIVTVESLVTTSSTSVAEGETALLERKIDPPSSGPAFLPVADVVVRKLLAKGRIELELRLEHPEATVKRKGRLAFAAGEKVRLQIDRQTPPPT